MIPNPQRIGHNSKRWVDRARGTKERAIDHVEVVHVVRPAIQIEDRSRRVFSKATRTALVSHSFQRNLLVQVKRSGDEMSLIIDRLQDFCPSGNEPVEVLVVGVGDRQLDTSTATDLDAIICRRQVFSCQPPVDGMGCHLLEGHAGCERNIRFEHTAVSLSEKLDVPHGPWEILRAPIKIVHRESLLKDGWIRHRRQAEHGTVDVPHIVATNLVGRVRQSTRIVVRDASEQQSSRVYRSSRNDDYAGPESADFARDFDLNTGNLPRTALRKQAEDFGVNENLHVAAFHGWAHAVDVRVRFAIHQARKTVAGAAANAGTVLGRRFVQLDRERNRERRVSSFGEFVEEFLDTRFMRNGREWVFRFRRGLGRVRSSLAMDLIESLGLGIVRLKVAILQGPLGRNASLMLNPFKIALSQPKHGAPVDLRIASHVVAGAGTKFLSVFVPPHLVSVIALLLKNCCRIPVFFFPSKKTAPFENKNALSTWRQPTRECSAARSGADNDHVVKVIAHVTYTSGTTAPLFRYIVATLLLLACLSNIGRAANVEISSAQMTVSDLNRSRAFYSDVLGFTSMGEKKSPSVTIASMRLGEETLLLSAPAVVGRPLPPAMQPNDRLFEHLAIVVSDMDAAYQRLRDHKVSVISSGPQTLPLWNFDAGYIRALYFRDPDGHFLELIQFPSDKGEPMWQRKDKLFLGFDHTAIVVRDIKASRHFYRDVLGFTLEGESYNYGKEQEMLSGIPGARVKINSFRGVRGPGIELLQYEEPGTAETIPGDPAANDIAYWQINIRKGSEEPTVRHDPDGHAFSLSPTGSSFADMREAFSHHWSRYLMEGAELGIFMIVALYLTIALEHPRAPLRRAIKSGLLRRFILGIGIGVTVMVLIYCPWGRQSGAQFNPAVTLARLSIDRIEPWDAFFYIVAQFIGGWLLLVLAGIPLKMLADHEKVKWVVTEPKEMGTAAAFIAEFLISFLILFSLLLVIHFPSLEWWIGVVAGLHLCAFITFEAPFSGMSLNPARSVASALPAQSWKAMWVYFVAPPLAMFLAAQLSRWLIDS